MHLPGLKGRVTDCELGCKYLWNCFSTKEEIMYFLTFPPTTQKTAFKVLSPASAPKVTAFHTTKSTIHLQVKW